jgi:7-cyano-7-deazaguanine synthase
MRALLFSGGIDSTVIAAWKAPDVLVTIDYGQRSAPGEIRAAAAIAKLLKTRHDILRVDCHSLGAGHLAGRPPSSLASAPEWWPYRNQLLITLCGMRYVTEELAEIMIGTVAGDEVHSDGRPEFLRAMNALMGLQEGAIRVSAPASHKMIEDLIAEVPSSLGLLAWTFSCHVGEYSCGQCRGCTKHKEVMARYL